MCLVYQVKTSCFFSTHHSALDPNKRKYKKIKIKITKDDDQLEIE
ncbi:hypothetical protein J540_4174 [Acinetobacter baumannii 1440422]|nr:hypothetical protein J540_4174 [Acinetobacter baumannii 1440422]